MSYCAFDHLDIPDQDVAALADIAESIETEAVALYNEHEGDGYPTPGPAEVIGWLVHHGLLSVDDVRRHLDERAAAIQILQALTGERTGWANHPATRMWAGHEAALAVYGYAVCSEWRRRGYRDTMRPWFAEQIRHFRDAGADPTPPWWTTDRANQSRHRAALLAKDAQHDWGWYTRLGWWEQPAANTMWPTHVPGQCVHIPKTTQRPARRTVAA